MKKPSIRATLLSGGWDLRPAAKPLGPISAPQNLIAAAGDKDGEVDLACDPVRGRISYIGQWTADPLGSWKKFHAGRKSSCTAGGLTPDAMHYFRMCAVGPHGQGPWSDIVTKRAS